MRDVLKEVFTVKKPVIGMVHLPPLPGSPGFKGSLEELVERALRDARALEEGGIDGVIVENINDIPYPPTSVPLETVTAMTVVVREVIKEVSVPVGVNVLANDYKAELAIAYATGAKFIRVENLVDYVVSDTGVLLPAASELQRYRKTLGAWNIKILGDVQVKHTYPLVKKDIRESAIEAEKRGMADAVIITGTATGVAAPVETLKAVKEVVSIPVFLGSGITAENISQYIKLADGFIIGTYLKVKGITTNPVDPERVKKLMNVVRELRREL